MMYLMPIFAEIIDIIERGKILSRHLTLTLKGRIVGCISREAISRKPC